MTDGNTYELVFRADMRTWQFTEGAKRITKELLGIGKATRQIQEGMTNLANNTARELRQRVSSFQEFRRISGIEKRELTQLNEMSIMNKNALNDLFNGTPSRLQILSNKMKEFKMELLGVMFFGMALKQSMFGLLRPAGEAVGMFEIWTTTLQVFFLPIMLTLLPLLLQFSMWLMEQPEWVKNVIGGFVLLLGTFGAFLFSYGVMSLGIRALIADLGNLSEVLGKFKISKAFSDFFGTGGYLSKLDALSKNPIVRTVSLIATIYFTWQFIKSTAQMFTDLKTPWNDRLGNVLNSTMAGATMGFLLFGTHGAVIGAVIGFSVSIILNILDWSWENDFDKKMASFYSKITSKVKSWIDKLTSYLYGKGGAVGKLASATFAGASTVLSSISTPYSSKTSSASKGFSYVNSNSSMSSYNDFLWKPGSPPISINPNDTLVGFKGNSPIGSNVNITQNISVTASNRDEIERAIRENNRTLVDDIRRLSAI